MATINTPIPPRAGQDDGVDSTGAGCGYTVVLRGQGWTFGVQPDESVLLGAEAAGVELPNSCRNGTCRTCLCQMLQGAVRYRIDWPGVSAEERADGWILPCVAYPTSELVLDVPAGLRV